MSIDLPDVQKSVRIFLQHFESLSRLPFINDAEMALLYGDEVISAIETLDRHNQQEKICQTCRDRCCSLIKCELYTPELKRCAISSFRPALCRMHFCHKFSPDYRELVKTIGDIFLDSLVAAGQINPRFPDFFDVPPLRRQASSLVDIALPLVESVRQGCLAEEQALKIIESEVEHYRTGQSPLPGAIIKM